jgi:hypothetical protein
VTAIALTLLLGLELSYYLLIVQTGLAESFHSDLFALSPLFIGGVLGSGLSGFDWGKVTHVAHKIILALSIQLLLSLFYPDYSVFMLFLLGLSVGALAPLAIFLFTPAYKLELVLALGFAYALGTYLFISNPLDRENMAVLLSAAALIMALVLRNLDVTKEKKLKTPPILLYLILMFWIMLDSNLFETLSRHQGLMIWRGEFTYTIISTHLLGLLVAWKTKMTQSCNHLFIAFLFALSYLFSYTESPYILALIYPFTISYYNVAVFRQLSIVDSPVKLGLLMVFIGWIASGAGLGLALSHLLH